MLDQETGPTFDISEIGWLDYESANKVEDIKAGTYRYATTADAVIAAYAIGGAAPVTVAVDEFPQTLTVKDMPDDFMAHHERVLQGKAVWAAWNAGFDRATWNYSMAWMPFMEPHHIIDVMAQASASGLAPDLKMAAKQTGSTHKVESGSDLIKLFCIIPPGKPLRSSFTGKVTSELEQQLVDALKTHAGMGTPQLFPELWKLFRFYAGGDIIAMRDIFLRTRQLPLREWREYWAAEKINERGICVDLKMAAHAAELADTDRQRSKEELSRITDGAVGTVDQVAKITNWLMSRALPDTGINILTKRAEETEVDEETGEEVTTKAAKYSLTRKQVVLLIALCQAATDRPDLKPVLRALQIRLYGGSKTPAKFARILSQHVDGVLMGQYVFNGAAQTGRFSSKGTQVHNLARDALEHEPALIEALLNRCAYDMLAKLGNDDPVSRKLSLLIRPTLVPDSGKLFVWSDWSQIEARVLPWLAGPGEEGALERLAIFAAVDADPKNVPDIYTRTAAKLSNIPIKEVTKPIRQRGKVAELALGFMGGAGALQNMAAAYGMHIEDDDAKDTVRVWRENNQWAVNFSQALWEAARIALDTPGFYAEAGRVGFVFLKTYLGGSLLMRLPSGRMLTYRAIRWEHVDVLDDEDKPTGEKKLELMFSRGYGRIKLWPGLFVENATQATAACFLRGTLVRLEQTDLRTRLHTHDEVLTEVEEAKAVATAHRLRKIMLQGFDWSEGLPLMSEETICGYYTKHEDSYDLWEEAA